MLQGLAHLAAIAIEQRNLTADLDYQAHHDPVTRLPNRALFEDRLRFAIAFSDRTDSSVGVLHVHLDRFQSITALLGRTVGDLVLEQVARRLESALRTTDTLTLAARHDFAVLLPGIDSVGDAEAVACRIHRLLAAPFVVGGHELEIAASIGIAVYPTHGASGVTLVLNAETAAQVARRNGPSAIQCFGPEMHAMNQQRLLIESALGRAVAHGELHLMFQPQVEAETRQVVGAEALLRWKHPTIGMVSPSAFIPVAEETGQILAIGRWTISAACRQAAQWATGEKVPLRIAVNVSGVQFRRDDFVPAVATILRETGLAPSSLEVELSEGALSQDIGRIAIVMEALRALGVSIAIDNFGTGYSWLSYLQQLPVDTIKISQSFVAQIANPYDCPAFIASIISMARSMGKKVVAEGVETAAQEVALIGMGCDILQGYRFGYPVKAATFHATWLSSHPIA
jgi:diguanylate cyclase (GGDEF)-like protein